MVLGDAYAELGKKEEALNIIKKPERLLKKMISILGISISCRLYESWEKTRKQSNF